MSRDRSAADADGDSYFVTPEPEFRRYQTGYWIDAGVAQAMQDREVQRRVRQVRESIRHTAAGAFATYHPAGEDTPRPFWEHPCFADLDT